MIIEFTGAPCSGKSAISHELASVLRANGYTVCEEQYELSHGASKIKRTLSKLTGALKFCLSHPLNSLRSLKQLRSVSLWLNYVSLRSHSCKNNICILEQGFCQLVGSVFDGKDVERLQILSLYDILLPKSDNIQIFVTVNRDTVYERATKRATENNDAPFFLNAQSPELAIDKAIALSMELRDCYAEVKGNDKVITVSNNENDNITAVAQVAFEALRGLL